MNLSQFLFALRARYKVVLLILAMTMAAATFVSLGLPKTYQASTSMVVNYRGVDSVTGMTLPSQMLPGYIATQVEIVKSRTVGLSVVDALKLTENPAAYGLLRKSSLLDNFKFGPTSGPEAADLRDALADAVLNSVDVVPSRESSVLTIIVKGRDPQLIKAIADAVAAGYLELSVKLKTEPAQRASSLITTQIAGLRENFEKAQKKLSQYQQTNNMSSTDNRADVESARLNDLSSQLVAVQSQAMEATSRQRQAQSNAAGSPDVVNNGLIQGLKQRLATAEAAFAIVQERLAANHPQYISAKSELDQVRKSLDDQIRTTSSSVVSNAAILQQRENTLRAALAAQKQKVLSMNGSRNELNLLTNEVDNARRAYETASQRFNQTNLEGQSKQTDIALLTTASLPKSPSGPSISKNVALSAVVGLILGIGAVLILELLDQRVRSASQLAEALDLPVLGSMVRSQSARLRRAGARFDQSLAPGPTHRAGSHFGATLMNTDVNASLLANANLQHNGALVDPELSIGSILISFGRLTAADAEKIMRHQIQNNQRFGDAGIALGLLTHADIEFALARQFEYPYLLRGESQISQEVVAAYDPFSSRVEALRGLRNQLMWRWFETGPLRRALAITSAERGEGRSLMAANLAVVFSQQGQRTLLIDADMRNPQQHKLFALENRSGLSSILSNRNSHQAIQTVASLRGLSILTAGPVPPNPLELLGRPIFESMLRQLASEFDVILIDTPSGSEFADAQTVAARTGAAIILTRQDKSHLRKVRNLVDMLAEARVHIVGTVLSQY